MKQIIRFCNKTAGSNWWLIATILMTIIPATIIFYTFDQFITTELRPEVIGRLFIGCEYSLFKFVWIDNHLICQKPFFGNLDTIGMWLSIDIALLYSMTFSETFFQIWRGNIFMSDPAVEFSGWSIPVMRFNAEKEVHFFRFLFSKKGYWFQPVGMPRGRRYEPVKQRVRSTLK
jgi:hypothetical protein